MEGYFLSALGVDHILMAHNFAITLRVNEDYRPICLLVKPEHVGFVRDLKLIEFVIAYEEQPDYMPLTTHERYCGMAKLDFHKKIPFDKYIMIDSDFLVAADTSHVWAMVNSFDAPVVNFGSYDAPYWHWNRLNDIERATDLKLSYTCGDIIFFNKQHEDFWNYIEECRDIFINKYDELGCKRMFGPNRSMTEEITFSISSARRGLRPIEMNLFPVLNYNPKPGESYKKFNYPFDAVKEKATTFHIIPPYIHLWDKYYGLNYQRVFFEIINKLVK